MEFNSGFKGLKAIGLLSGLREQLNYCCCRFCHMVCHLTHTFHGTDYVCKVEDRCSTWMAVHGQGLGCLLGFSGNPWICLDSFYYLCLRVWRFVILSVYFILEMFSIRYVNTFGFFLLFVSTGLTVFYSFRLLYFVLGGDLNFVPSYSMVETSYNMMIGTVDLCCILRCLVEIRYFFCLSVAAPLICEATYKSFFTSSGKSWHQSVSRGLQYITSFL